MWECAGGAAEGEEEEAGGERVERAGVTDLGALGVASDAGADVGGGGAEGLVDEEEAVEVRALVAGSSWHGGRG